MKGLNIGIILVIVELIITHRDLVIVAPVVTGQEHVRVYMTGRYKRGTWAMECTHFSPEEDHSQSPLYSRKIRRTDF